MTLPRLIGITGKKHSGKTEASNFIIMRHGFTKVSFADPLKHMLWSLGLTKEQLWGDEKEVPLDILGGQTGRHAMQTLGTEWGRELIHEDIWINAWAHTIQKHRTPVVVDDLRFLNEAKIIKKLGGVILKINRLNNDSNDSHSSETEMNEIYHTEEIFNDGSIIELGAKISEFFDDFKEQKNEEPELVDTPAKDWEPKYPRDVANKGLSKLKSRG